jgi:acetate kinase
MEMLVFAGGIGERSAPVRANVCGRLGLLGVNLDAGRNDASEPVLSSGASLIEVRIVPAQEEIQIAREVRARL